MQIENCNNGKRYKILERNYIIHTFVRTARGWASIY